MVVTLLKAKNIVTHLGDCVSPEAGYHSADRNLPRKFTLLLELLLTALKCVDQTPAHCWISVLYLYLIPILLSVVERRERERPPPSAFQVLSTILLSSLRHSIAVFGLRLIRPRFLPLPSFE